MQRVAAHGDSQDRADDRGEEDADHAAHRAGPAQQDAVERERDPGAHRTEHEQRAERLEVDPAAHQAEHAIRQRQHAGDHSHPQHRRQRSVLLIHRPGDVGGERVAQQGDGQQQDSLQISRGTLVDRGDRDHRDPGEPDQHGDHPEDRRGAAHPDRRHDRADDGQAAVDHPGDRRADRALGDRVQKKRDGHP